MIRFACPRCQAVLEQPEEAAGTTIACLSCGQHLQIPAAPTGRPVSSPEVSADTSGSMVPAPPLLASSRQMASAPPIAPPAASSESTASTPRRRDDDDREYDDYYDDDDVPSIARQRWRGRYAPEFSAKAAFSGLMCSLLSMGLLVASFVLWIFTIENQNAGMRGQPLIVLCFVVVVASIILALLGMIFSNRGLDDSNRHNRGQAMAGLVCGIVALVIGSVVGFFTFCMGLLILSFGG
jgi:hypothetical protein